MSAFRRPLGSRCPLAAQWAIPPTTSAHHLTSSSAPITVPFLSGILATLTAWRFRTFYVDFLPSYCASDNPAALVAPLQDALRTMDWARLSNELESQCRSHETWWKKGPGMGYLAALFIREKQAYDVARDAARTTRIPLRQIRKVVDACAFWVAGDGIRHDQGRRANGSGRTLTAGWVAGRKEWEGLARTILEDMNDLQQGDAWVENALGNTASQRDGMATAVQACGERYFAHLRYAEEPAEGFCNRTMGRIGRRFGTSWGKEETRAERSISARRKLDWSLRLLEGDSLEGNDELVREMHKRHKRDGVKEAREAVERFAID